MGRKKGEAVSEAQVVSAAKGKGKEKGGVRSVGAVGAVGSVGSVGVKEKEGAKGGKKVAVSERVEEGGAVGEGEGVGGVPVKKGGWRQRRGGVPVSSSWSSRQWATVGVLSTVSVEQPCVSMRDLRKWWKTYAPGEWRSEYGVLAKELDGLSKLKFVRISRKGGRVRATKKYLGLLCGSGG